MIRSSLRKGFTLIELLLVVIIIGIVASIALPRFASVKGAAYTAVLNSDLKTYNTTQELQFAKTSAYNIQTSCASGACAGWDTTSGVSYSPSQDVNVSSVTGATNGTNAIGYYAKATHAKLPATTGAMSAGKARCVNIGELLASSPTGFDNASGNGVQYNCN